MYIMQHSVQTMVTVTDLSIDRKNLSDFLLVINSNLGPIPYCTISKIQQIVGRKLQIFHIKLLRENSFQFLDETYIAKISYATKRW